MINGTIDTAPKIPALPGQETEDRQQQLLETFPDGGSYLEKFAGLRSRFAVIKVGGAIIDDEEQLRTTAADLAGLQGVGLAPIVVHGGGKQIDEELAKRGQRTEKVNGIRVTRQEHMSAVAAALATVNTILCDSVREEGGLAAGVDGVFAATLDDPDNFVADQIVGVNSSETEKLALANVLPVVSCIGHLAVEGDCKQPVNINADCSAGALASHLNVLKYISLTAEGAITDGKQRIDNITIQDARELIQKGIIHGGMVPKVEEALRLLENGVHDVVITSPADLMKELFTDGGAGTIVHIDDNLGSL